MENQFTTPLPPQTDIPVRPKSWLVESILVTILLFPILGIIAIINAAKVNSLYDQGLYDKSKRASGNAKKWTMIALIVGVISIILFVLFYWYY